jgi:hypothetical protein
MRRFPATVIAAEIIADDAVLQHKPQLLRHELILEGEFDIISFRQVQRFRKPADHKVNSDKKIWLPCQNQVQELTISPCLKTSGKTGKIHR